MKKINVLMPVNEWIEAGGRFEAGMTLYYGKDYASNYTLLQYDDQLQTWIGDYGRVKAPVSTYKYTYIKVSVYLADQVDNLTKAISGLVELLPRYDNH